MPHRHPQVGDPGGRDAHLGVAERDVLGRQAGKNGRPPPMTTGTRSIATTSSRPSCRHWAAIVPAATATVLAARDLLGAGDRRRHAVGHELNGASGWSRTQAVGHLCVTTTTGASIVWRPPQPSVTSNSVRPQTITPSPAVHARQ